MTLRSRTARIAPYLLGALLFGLVFGLRYANTPAEFYQHRDDGVITMSHARNWVEYGVIGPNPSGGRLEGFSAPVQFALSALGYALTRAGYETQALVQTVVFTLLLGAVWVGLLGPIRRWGWAWFLLVPVLLVDQTSFLLWHGSGLENPITHVAILSMLWQLGRMLEIGRFHWPAVVLPAVAAVSRLDGLYHVGPVLAVFAVAWWVSHRNGVGLLTAAAALGGACLVHVVRYLYFGDWLSNTAHAQALGLSDRLDLIAAGNWGFLEYSWRISAEVFRSHGGWMLLPFLFGLPFVRRGRERVFLVLSSLLLVVTAVANPLVLGRTTLDPTRTTTQMALCVVLLIAIVGMDVWRRPRGRWVLIPVALLALSGHLGTRQVPYELCCPTEGFEAYRAEFREVAEREGLRRPTVANADLGAMSWHKDFNVVDIGALGNVFFAHLRHGPLLSEYFFEWMAPDIVESHEAWSCRYFDEIFSDPRFRERYLPIREEWVDWDRCANGPLPVGVWVRRDMLRAATGEERRLTDRLDQELSVDAVRESLHRVRDRSEVESETGWATSAAVARAAYRFLPEFVAAGQGDDLRTVFATGNASEFDRFLISRGSDTEAFPALADHLLDDFLDRRIGPKPERPQPDAAGTLDVYVVEDDLILYKESCPRSVTDGRLFLAVRGPAFEENQGIVFDEDFHEVGYRVGESALAVLELPPGRIEDIVVGLRSGSETVWKVRCPPPSSRTGTESGSVDR